MRPFTGAVALTGLNATDNPGPGVAVAQALRRDPLFQGRIVGLAYDMLDPGLFLPGLLDAAYLIPYPSAGRDALLSRLAYVQGREAAAVLLPNLDSELPLLVGREDDLADLGLSALLPDKASLEARDKAHLHELVEHGVPVPRAEIHLDDSRLLTLHERFDLPVVVKSPLYGAEVAHTSGDAVAAFHHQAAKWGVPIIVQEYVDGEEVNVCALGDGRGGLVGAVAMKKMLLTDKGKGWAGVAIREPRLMALAAHIVEVLRWRGPCEIEVRRDHAGDYHLLEINPRFPAWVDLTQGAGQNQPLAALHLALGHAVEPLDDYRPGAAFVRISINQQIDVADLETLSTHGERTADTPRRTA